MNVSISYIALSLSLYKPKNQINKSITRFAHVVIVLKYRITRRFHPTWPGPKGNLPCPTPRLASSRRIDQCPDPVMDFQPRLVLVWTITTLKLWYANYAQVLDEKKCIKSYQRKNHLVLGFFDDATASWKSLVYHGPLLSQLFFGPGKLRSTDSPRWGHEVKLGVFSIEKDGVFVKKWGEYPSSLITTGIQKLDEQITNSKNTNCIATGRISFPIPKKNPYISIHLTFQAEYKLG